MQYAYLTGAIGIALVAIAAWLDVKGKDASWLFVVAVVFLLQTCTTSAVQNISSSIGSAVSK